LHPTYKAWFNVFKRQPSGEGGLIVLASTLYSENKTDRLVEHLENNEVTAGFRTILSRIKGGRTTIDDIMARLPNPNVTKEEAQERLDRIVQAAKFETVSTLGELLDEAIALGLKINNPDIETTQADEGKLAKLVQKIIDSSKKGSTILRTDKVTREKLEYFNRVLRPKEKFTIKFKFIPENREEFDESLQNIARIVVDERTIGEEKVITYLGEVEGDKIVTVFDEKSDFLRFLQQFEEKRKIFVKNAEKFVPDIGEVRVSRKRKKRKKQLSAEKLQDLIVRGVEFTPASISNYSDVERYLKAIQKVPYSILDFLPKTLQSGSVSRTFGEGDDEVSVDFQATYNFPPSFFLTRESAKASRGRGTRSLVLNPFANLLLKNPYTKENWFRDFFGDVRKTAIVSKKLTETMVLNDIYNMITQNKPSSYGMNRDRYRDVEPNSLGNIETGRARLREKIQTNPTLLTEFNNAVNPASANALSFLKTDFSEEEARQIESMWNEELEEEHGELEVEYKKEDSFRYATVMLDDEPVSPTKMRKILSEENLTLPENQFRELVEDAIESEKSDNRFIAYVLSLENDEIEGILDTDEMSANFMDKLNPKNSLTFLAKVSEVMMGENENLIYDALEKVADTEDDTEKMKILNDLNKKMPKFLKDFKEAMFGAFQNKLNDFAKNYINVAGRSRDKAIRAIEALKKEGLLEGE
tara:strand:- start:5165 stop:7261 length:2097 start_codon:yes stop_codon:yes gene_type:complete